MITVTCCQCRDERQVESRREARVVLCWEPYSNATQQLLDEGPLVCPRCVMRALDALELAILKWSRRAG